MPPKGYKSITLKVDVYERLEGLRVELGLTSINDLIVHLLTMCRAEVTREVKVTPEAPKAAEVTKPEAIAEVKPIEVKVTPIEVTKPIEVKAEAPKAEVKPEVKPEVQKVEVKPMEAPKVKTEEEYIVEASKLLEKARELTAEELAVFKYFVEEISVGDIRTVKELKQLGISNPQAILANLVSMGLLERGRDSYSLVKPLRIYVSRRGKKNVLKQLP